jgi:HSP20 family protein
MCGMFAARVSRTALLAAERKVDMARSNGIAQNQAIEKSSANQVQVRQAPAPINEPSAWSFTPGIDVHDIGSEWLVRADIPGADPQNITLTVDDGILTLHAPVPNRWPGKASMRLAEYMIGDYHRTFRVGEDIDAEQIHAELDSGVLTLHLPKAPHAQPRKIPIRTA